MGRGEDTPTTSSLERKNIMKKIYFPEAYRKAGWKIFGWLLIPLAIALLYAFRSLWLPLVTPQLVQMGLMEEPTPVVVVDINTPEDAVREGVIAMGVVDYTENMNDWVDRVCAVSTEPGCDYFKNSDASGLWNTVTTNRIQISAINFSDFRMITEVPLADENGNVIGRLQVWEYHSTIEGNYANWYSGPSYVAVANLGDGVWRFDHSLSSTQIKVLKNAGLIP